MTNTLASFDSADLRRELRQASQVMPLGWSAGGRRFSFQAPLTLPLMGGGYALLTTAEGTRYLGQVLDRVVTERTGPTWTLEMEQGAGSTPGPVREAQVEVPIRLLEGSGDLLARLDGVELVDIAADDAFREADLAAAPAELVAAFMDRADAGATLLDIGEATAGGRGRLHAEGFARHTFLCGQSGAGKTYALGVVLERLLIQTELRLVVLDPNGDYVGLGSAAENVRVFSREHAPLRLRFDELTPATRAAVVGLDPLRDMDEYAAFDRLAEGRGSLQEVRDAARTEAERVGLRIDNLAIDRWDLWATEGEASVLDSVMGARATVADLSSLDTPEEQALAAGAVLAHLWQRRAERRPALVVIDEAHNVCPAGEPARLGAEARDLVVRIAGEGRKYGLYLLLVTQRPEKLEPNGLTQSDNLILLRLNGAQDVARLASAFSFVAPSLLAEAPSFAKGEALIAGGIVGRPTRARFGGRVSPEGGGDVPTSWARPR